MKNNKRNKNSCKNKQTVSVKQSFLSSAISDISTYIQLSDTKVSIIMGAVVALIAGLLACAETMIQTFRQIKPCSLFGIVIFMLFLFHLCSLVGVFYFGILTIRGHVSNVDYKSKWFLPKSASDYSFASHRRDIKRMSDEDVIENMAAELYKLNDIYRQKSVTTKWTIYSFASTLITGAIIGGLLLLYIL